jgi:uncharacterized protein YrrD
VWACAYVGTPRADAVLTFHSALDATMLHSLKDLTGFSLAAQDGEIGRLREAYFDDARWTLRHLVVDTGGWLSGRRVLVAPHAVRGIDITAQQVAVQLSREQVEHAPSVDADRPVSRQHEHDLYDFYGYPYYWGGSGLWGTLDMPMGGAIAPFTPPLPTEAERLARQAAHDNADPHLRSSAEVRGYEVRATDGSIGHVDDFLFDAATWRIEWLVVDTHDWLPDRLVVVPPRLVLGVDWAARQASVRLSKQAVHDSPPYQRTQPLGQDQVMAAQRHFESMV